MDIGTMIFWGLLVVIVFYAVIIYNNLVRLKHNVSKAWANIDVLLKQRHDELPKLVETCRQYMGYEQDTLERVMRARSAVSDARQRGDVGALGQAESQLRLGLGNLFAVAEAYPELKADETYRHLQARITALENAIADRREFYNESVNVNNIRIEQVPDVFVARLFGFGPRELLEFSEQERADVDVRALFSS
jgi:LemA protein